MSSSCYLVLNGFNPAERRTPFLPVTATPTNQLTAAAIAVAGALLMPLSPLQAQESAPPPAETALPEVNVKAERESAYQKTQTRIGRQQQDVRDVPQSLTIVPEALINDRNADTLREALRNVAALTFNAGEGGRIGDNITLRGYSAVGDLFLDGVRDVAQYNREVFNLEQVEVLRGSASMMFGRGSTGGVINQVSKRPFLSDQAQVQATVGSYDYRRGTLDVNRVVAPNAAVRLNAMVTDTDSFRQAVEQKRNGVAPSISVGIGTANEFSLAHFYLHEKNRPDFGVPYFDGRPVPVPTERFYGLATDYERNDTAMTTGTWTHRFQGPTELRTLVRHAHYERNLWATAPRLTPGITSIDDNTLVNRQRQARGGDEETLTAQADLTTRLKAFGVEHQWLLGAELQREEAMRWTWATAIANPPTTLGAPNPYEVLPPGYQADRAHSAEVQYRSNNAGLYAQDMLSLSQVWKLLLGARWDQLDARYDRPLPQGDLARKDSVWSTRAGVIWQRDEQQSYYLSYGSSFNPSAELYALDDRSVNTPPEKSRNLELGTRWELAEGRAMLRGAVFRSQKTNERNTDLSTPDVYLLSGKRHTDGIELEVTGRLTSTLELFASTALMRGEIDVASGQQANSQGKTPINTPRYTSSLWTAWRFMPRWRVGAGVEAVGKRYGNTTNVNAAPSYVRWDALLEYEREQWAVKLNLFNLFDRTYYEGVYAGHVVPGTPRNAQVSLKVQL